MIALNPKTDMAIDILEGLKANLSGIEQSRYFFGKTEIIKVRVKTDFAAQRIGKPIGEYITAHIPDILCCNGNSREAEDAVVEELTKLLPKSIKTALIIGLGNRDITPDALGPKAAAKVLATRHITDLNIFPAHFSRVAVLSPGVLGQTGIETGELVCSVSRNIGADAVIAVDALRSLSTARMCRTIQLSNSGIIPGAGVGNARFELSYKTLGIPVISIGVPTVVGAKRDEEDRSTAELIVTPSDIDSKISAFADVLGLAINRCLHPKFSREDLIALI